MSKDKGTSFNRADSMRLFGHELCTFSNGNEK